METKPLEQITSQAELESLLLNANASQPLVKPLVELLVELFVGEIRLLEIMHNKPCDYTAFTNDEWCKAYLGWLEKDCI